MSQCESQVKIGENTLCFPEAHRSKIVTDNTNDIDARASDLSIQIDQWNSDCVTVQARLEIDLGLFRDSHVEMSVHRPKLLVSFKSTSPPASPPPSILLLLLRYRDYVPKSFSDFNLLSCLDGKLKFIRCLEHEHDRTPQTEAAHLLRWSQRLAIKDWRGLVIDCFHVGPRWRRAASEVCAESLIVRL